MPKFNPFSPRRLVHPNMFAGRGDILLVLEQLLFQTKNENPQHFLIQGERGIGKSSLLLVLDLIASGKLDFEHPQMNFIKVSTELQPDITYHDIIRKIGAELQRVMSSHKSASQFVKGAWDFLKKWEAFGVKYAHEPKSAPQGHELLEDLVHTVSTTMETLADKCDGLLITIDEADKPAPQANLGEFAKIFTERLAKRGCNRVLLGLAGLPHTLDRLRQSHESAPRIFQDIPLLPLKPEERVEVVRKGLVAANVKNTQATVIDPKAEELISNLSEGYPHFIQQFAYCAFDHDTDNMISVSDVHESAFARNGAFHQLGEHYFHEWYWEQIRSDAYRVVLREMAKHFDSWVTKADIRNATGLKNTILTNAISTLKNRNIIIIQKGRQGVYRLPSRAFAVWINGFASETPAEMATEAPRG